MWDFVDLKTGPGRIVKGGGVVRPVLPPLATGLQEVAGNGENSQTEVAYVGHITRHTSLEETLSTWTMPGLRSQFTVQFSGSIAV